MIFNKIKYIREDLELSQRELASQLNVPKSTYAWWEKNEKSIPLKKLLTLCNISHYSIDFALDLTNEKKRIDVPYALDYIKIGNNIKDLRLKAKLSQREFAKTLNTTHKTIYRVENGQIKKLTSFLFELAKKYNISLDKILR